MLKSLYVEGDTLFHRLSARVKLIALLLLGIVLFPISSFWVLVPVFLIAAALYLTVGLSFRDALSRIGFVLFTILVLMLVNLYIGPWHEAVATTFRLIAVVLFAAAVTATTTIDAFMDEITILLTPLERIGLVKARDVSLALGLVLRFVPDIFARYQTLKEAHEARGIRVRIRTILGPLIILTLKDADMIASAIDARGIRGQ
ncbi:energy-coupling factor transporter transmembrane component T family protein [Rhizobium sp. NRK18]|uniref:energy-coupling factor transporter transmembrane component T family protein n=1 Tax=Rhizobium sp. NRK18 TaxID=2964667 RepID=UPI0021C30E5F|nr:energy-coupling factor transporter transmembrane protein EcfT [Rhizobium sp. NRK18]MCQ2005097.1 energy-coupling factor transporter transmembrane protein EcfT [Rhizobium sp. NRK18]